MSPVDVGILAIVGFSGFFGLLRGAVREVFGFAALVLGLFLGITFYPEAALLLQARIHDALLAQAVAFFGIWLLAWIAFALFGALLRRIVRFLRLGWADRFAGLVFGLARGALLISLLAVSFAAFEITPRHLVHSKISLRILDAGDAIKGAFPREFLKRFSQGLSRVRLQLQKNHAQGAGGENEKRSTHESSDEARHW
jgi:membrane protein required for colicin V production